MPEAAMTYGLLCAAALAAGMVNAVAGGGTLLTFPTLLVVLPGLVPEPAKTANATSTVALMPGSAASAVGYRQELADSRPWLLLLVGPSVVGGLLGSLLATRLPEAVFAAVVPWLILVATILLAAQPVISRRLGLVGAGEHDDTPRPPPTGLARAGVVGFQFLVGLYGGYFGAGIGILMLASLALVGVGDIHRMNGLKTVLAGLINALAAGVFIVESRVYWPFALAMAVAAMLGGYTGAGLARRLEKNLVRRIVVAIGFGLTGYYLWKQWGEPS